MIRNPSNQLIGSLSQFLQGLMISGGDRRISAINSQLPLTATLWNSDWWVPPQQMNECLYK